MKSRTTNFLSEEAINHESEQFDYIKELHYYLWKFVRLVIPNANGNLSNFVDLALEKLSEDTKIIDKMKAFINDLFEEYFPDMGDIEESLFLDLAAKHGILTRNHCEPEEGNCNCSQLYNIGNCQLKDVVCYRLSDSLK